MRALLTTLRLQVTPDCCIVCPAHGTAFDLATGAVKGEWCPGFPDLPFVVRAQSVQRQANRRLQLLPQGLTLPRAQGKMKPPAPLPVFTVQVTGDDVAVSV